jgi:hypothetical protein
MMQRERLRSHGSVVLLACSLAGLISCGDTSARIEITPSEVEVGQKAVIKVMVENPPSHAIFAWRAERGTLDPQESDQLTTTYIAPAQPGIDRVTLDIKSADGMVLSQGIEVRVKQQAERNGPAASTPPLQGAQMLVADFSGAPGSGGLIWGAFFNPGWGFAKDSVEDDDSSHGKKLMRIEYDVSKNDDFSGFWLKFKLAQFRPADWKVVTFRLRGDGRTGYSTRLKVELKVNEDRWGWRTLYIDNLTEKWQRYSLSLGEFQLLQEFTGTDEFVLTFENKVATVKKGVVYLADVAFER